jgi:nitrogen fixation protein NifM
MQTKKHAIAENDIDHAYHLLQAALNKYGKNPNELKPSELKEATLQATKAFDLESLILSSTEARNVVLTQSLLRKSMDEIKSRYSSDDDFIEDLKKNNLDDKKLYTALFRELLVETVLDKVGSRAAAVNELDVMIYFYLHKDKFNKPETRETYHILITLNDDYEENKFETATSRLEDIRKRLLKKPERFSEQAMKHSECPTALRDGFLGNIPKGELYPELEKVLFNMKENEISEIVESPIGLHLLYCKSISNAGAVTMKMAEPKIREHMLGKRRRMCKKNWLSELTTGNTNKQTEV